MTAHREIERKFLVTGEDFREEATSSSRVVQGYLSSVPERVVRVRLRDGRGYLTVKGESTADGLSRALDARCYEGGEGRTHFHEQRLGAKDAVAALVTLAFVAALVALA